MMAQMLHPSIHQNNAECLSIQISRAVTGAMLDAGKAFFGVQKC